MVGVTEVVGVRHGENKNKTMKKKKQPSFLGTIVLTVGLVIYLFFIFIVFIFYKLCT